MPRIPDEPLRKVTLNLYNEDVIWFQQTYGQGYSEMIRALVHSHVQYRRTCKEDEGGFGCLTR